MTKRYDALMERIKLSDEARERIMENIQEMELKGAPALLETSSAAGKKASFGRFLPLAACFLLVAAGALAGTRLLNQAEDPLVQVIPDIVECASAEELADTVGFAVNDIEALPFEAESRQYTSYWRELAQITYSGGGQSAVFRKSLGEEDNSGDYQLYDEVVETAFDGLTVTLKGGGGKYALAFWSDEGFAYSLRLSGGISEAAWARLIGGAVR